MVLSPDLVSDIPQLHGVISFRWLVTWCSSAVSAVGERAGARQGTARPYDDLAVAINLIKSAR